MKEKIKNIAEGFWGIICFVGFFVIIGLIVALLIEGGAWLSALLYPWLIRIFTISLGVSIFILLPLAVFKRTRIISAIGLLIASYVFGATMWIWSFLLVYLFWGFLGLLIGLFLLGIGVVPIAMLATLFNAEWSILIQLIFLVVLTYGTMIFASYLEEKAMKDEYVYSKEVEQADYEEIERLYCSMCGEQVDSDSMYCQKCGNKIY